MRNERDSKAIRASVFVATHFSVPSPFKIIELTFEKSFKRVHYPSLLEAYKTIYSPFTLNSYRAIHCKLLGGGNIHPTCKVAKPKRDDLHERTI